jgi:hypothetical protein
MSLSCTAETRIVPRRKHERHVGVLRVQWWALGGRATALGAAAACCGPGICVAALTQLLYSRLRIV